MMTRGLILVNCLRIQLTNNKIHRVSMAKKCLRELMVVGVVVLIIPLVFIVQANDLSSRSLFTSSLHVRLLHPRPHAKSARSLYHCLEMTLEKCKETHEPESLEFKECIIRNFFQCIYKHRKYLEGTEAIYTNAIMCIEKCFPKSKAFHVNGATCLLECFEEHIKEH
jgi:hypothetical protein